MDRPHISALTSIRFFFAMMVLVGHFCGHFSSQIGPLPGFIHMMAPIAVSWFFVLSGFIIAYNYPTLQNTNTRRNFLITRVARLWPIHVVTTFAMIFLEGGAKYYLFIFTMTHTWTGSPD